MKRSEKTEFIKTLKEDISKSSSVIVSHYAGLTVNETDELRKAMRDNGAKFRVTKNRLTKLALEDTQYKNIIEFFSGPTAVAYSDDPVSPAKISVEFEKKFENFKILGGSFEGEKIDKERIKFLATLPSLDEIRAKILGLISAPAQKVASVLQAPAGQLVRILESKSKKVENSS